MLIVRRLLRDGRRLRLHHFRANLWLFPNSCCTAKHLTLGVISRLLVEGSGSEILAHGRRVLALFAILSVRRCVAAGLVQSTPDASAKH